MRPSVYVEISTISYLAARPSRDLIVAARQQVTHTWWRERRPAFDLYVSQVILDEILAGDPGHSDEEDREITIGGWGRRRVLFVAHSARNDRIGIISARRATRRERRQYEEGIGEATQ